MTGGKLMHLLWQKRLHKEKAITLDGIISSPAKRAFSTAKFFAEEFDIKKKNIMEETGLIQCLY
jgi:broad specificity phosphatase PhoE